jgi:hypothetical protein
MLYLQNHCQQSKFVRVIDLQVVLEEDGFGSIQHELEAGDDTRRMIVCSEYPSMDVRS